MTATRRFLWLCAGSIFAFGVFAVGDWTSGSWVLQTLFVYSIPLACQLTRSSLVGAYGVWWGVFLIAQTLLTPVFDQTFNYKTLPPGLAHEFQRSNGARVVVTTDPMGFRTNQKIDYAVKPNDVLRIVAIGGSTTEELWTDDRSTWATLLGKRLEATPGYRGVEVINTGVSGLRAVQHLATLRRSLDWHPDIAIFLLGINDWNYHIHRAHGAVLPGLGTESLEFSRSPLAGLELALKHQWDLRKPIDPSEFEAAVASQADSLNRPDVREFRPSAPLPSYREALDEIAALCRRAELACVFVTQPTAYRTQAPRDLQKRFWMTPPRRGYTLDLDSLRYIADLYNQHLLTLSRENHLVSCDLAGHLERSSRSFEDDCHFSSEGSVAVAEFLAECIRSNGLAGSG